MFLSRCRGGTVVAGVPTGGFCGRQGSRAAVGSWGAGADTLSGLPQSRCQNRCWIDASELIPLGTTGAFPHQKLAHAGQRAGTGPLARRGRGRQSRKPVPKKQTQFGTELLSETRLMNRIGSIFGVPLFPKPRRRAGSPGRTRGAGFVRSSARSRRRLRPRSDRTACRRRPRSSGGRPRAGRPSCTGGRW